MIINSNLAVGLEVIRHEHRSQVDIGQLIDLGKNETILRRNQVRKIYILSLIICKARSSNTLNLK